MTLAELQRALTSVEPAAVLVPPRVMESIVRQVLELSGLVWSVPHSQSWIVDRTLLFRHVDQADLVLAPDQILPATVILLRWPNEEDLLRGNEANIRLQIWRQLFHASIHQAVESCWENGALTPTRLREHIETIGTTAFEEIQAVLKQEFILVADADPRAVFNEFAAVFLEMYAFSPALLPTFFPGLGDSQAVKNLFDQDIDSDAILRRTRLPEAIDPIVATESTASEAHEFFHALKASSQNAMSRGNMVQAAIQLQRAVRVAPADQAPQTRKQAITILADLLDRLKTALELPEDECVGWGRLLPILLDKADQGSRPAEAALLHELQNICLDHEREMYKLDVVEYVLSAGRRPLKRPLPSQRLVRITRTLRGAVPMLTAARLSDQDRGELESLLQKALNRSENRVRSRFRPLVTNALQDVGLSPKNPLETVSFHKMVEELLDRVIDSGFLTFSDLRDTISRNQLKLPDLTDPHHFIRGDPLIRLDRRLATVLDGVYRPGEFYLRWLERFTALNFGTKLGRLFTRYVTLPVGGGFILLFALIRVFHLQGHEPSIHEVAPGPFKSGGPAAAAVAPRVVPDDAILVGADASWAWLKGDRPPDDAILIGTDATWSWLKGGRPDAAVATEPLLNELNISLWIALSTIIFALIHSKTLRANLANRGRALVRSLRKAFVDFPLWVARHESLRQFLTSAPFHLFVWYVVKPGLVTALFVTLVDRLRESWLEVVLCFLAANFLINSRPGEVIGHTTLKLFHDFFDLLRGGLLPGLIRFIDRWYKQILRSIEGGIFTVDEWLRFRGGETNAQVFVRSVATLIWMPISYLARFNLVVLIEPCFHPLKFPVVTVATKFYLPFAYMIEQTMTGWINPVLGNVLTKIVVWWIVFWLPDVFGFIFWEMKENWSLYRANRRQNVTPVPIGVHGETIRNYFQPGFHAGTLPKLFAKIRHAETRALQTGNYSAVRQYRATLAEIEETLHKFIGRELCVLLEQSAVWRGQSLHANRVELSSNRIRFHLAHPNFPDQPMLITFENRAGWIVAGLNAAPWLASLSPEAQADLHNALVLLYKIAGVDLVREQVDALLPSPLDHYDFSAQGLVIWPADRQGKELCVDLRPSLEPKEPVEFDPTVSILTWDPERVLFSNRPLTRTECLICWPSHPDASKSPPRLLGSVPILPPPAKADERESAA